MGGGATSSVDVHWPRFIDSSPSSIGSGFGYGNQVIDDYSLAMAAPPSVWGNSSSSMSQISPGATGNVLNSGYGQLNYGNGLFNMHVASQLSFKPPQVSVGFGPGAASGLGGINLGSLMNNSSIIQAGSRPMPTALGTGTLMDVTQVAPGLGQTGGLAGNRNLVTGMSRAPLLQQQQSTAGATSGFGIGGGLAGTSPFMDMSTVVPGLHLQQQQHQQQQHVGSGFGSLFDMTSFGFPSALDNGGLLGMPSPLPQQQAPELAGNVVDLLSMPVSLPLQQPRVMPGSTDGSFVDLPSQFQLTSIPDLPDLVGLSDLADLPSIPAAVGTQAYKQEPAQNYMTLSAADAPVTFLGSSTGLSDPIVAPPLRFADLNVASIPYDNRLGLRPAFGTQLPPPLLSSGRGDLRDAGMSSLFPSPPALGVLGLPGGSLVLDGSRSELINISKMTPQEILDAKALAASKNHSEAERRRRERINTHLGTLRTLLPSSTKTDKASLLGEVIEHVRGLKRQAAEVEGPVPSETEELTVERGEPYAEQPGRPVIKVTVCCDDRPGVLTDLARTLDGCKLENFHMELATISGRIKVVMQAYSTDETLAERGVSEAFLANVQDALRSVVDKAGATDNSSGSSGGGLKRQRTMSNSPP